MASAHERIRAAHAAVAAGFHRSPSAPQELRDADDYDAREISDDEARDLIVDSERLVAEVASMLVPEADR
jgi:hypothetical protein